MAEPEKASFPLPKLLEQLGALGSLLIHDVANQMCIISGNATFAQMMMEDPQQLARAIEAINKSSERVSFIISQCAEFRRRLAGELPRGDAAVTLESLRAVMAQRPGWVVDIQGDLRGQLMVPGEWVSYALDQLLRETATAVGTVTVRRASPEADTTFLPGGTYLKIRLRWESARALSIEELRLRFENFGLLAAFELIRQCGGRLEGFTSAEGSQEALLCVPFALEQEIRAG